MNLSLLGRKCPTPDAKFGAFGPLSFFCRGHARSIEWAMATENPSSPAPTPPERPGRPTRPSRSSDGAGALVVERQTARVKPPSPFQVVMLNDDYTPMEFVIHVLQQHFHHDLETATMIMLKIHHEGRGVCGVYPKDVAATKVELVLAAARRHQHPLQCIMEAS